MWASFSGTGNCSSNQTWAAAKASFTLRESERLRQGVSVSKGDCGQISIQLRMVLSM